jgi:hypothetical protein
LRAHHARQQKQAGSQDKVSDASGFHIVNILMSGHSPKTFQRDVPNTFAKAGQGFHDWVTRWAFVSASLAGAWCFVLIELSDHQRPDNNRLSWSQIEFAP